MKVISLEAFKAEATKRFGEDAKKWQFKCVKCGTTQSAEDLVAAGVPKEKVDRFIGFSCIGRWDKNKGCDWTLGGLFTIHEIEIETPDGKRHPHFELAPEGEKP